MTTEHARAIAEGRDLTAVIAARIEDDADGKWICREFASGVVERVLTIPSKAWHDARTAEQAVAAAAEVASGVDAK